MSDMCDMPRTLPQSGSWSTSGQHDSMLPSSWMILLSWSMSFSPGIKGLRPEGGQGGRQGIRGLRPGGEQGPQQGAGGRRAAVPKPRPAYLALIKSSSSKHSQPHSPAPAPAATR